MQSLKCDNFAHKSIQTSDYPFSEVFILTCLSLRHVKASCDDVDKFIKDNKSELFGLKKNAAYTHSSAVLMDNSGSDGWSAIEIKPLKAIVHLFTVDAREKYKLDAHVAKID